MIIGIDIGGTKIAAIYGDKFLKFKTPTVKREFIKLLKKLPKAELVGIGAAGIVRGTEIKSLGNIPSIKNFDLKKFFPRVRAENDAQSFLRAELAQRRLSGKILGITIGTGIGRAFFNSKKINRIEYPEGWEATYQRIRDHGTDQELADFLGIKLQKIIKKYNPNIIIIGGGVLNRVGFYKKLSKKLGVKTLPSKLGDKAGAIGAAMLWK